MSRGLRGFDWREAARIASEPFGCVLSRRHLRDLGIGREATARAVASGRWAAHGAQTIAMHTGPLTEEAHRWRAVWEVGPKVAALDGVTALQVAGLTGFNDSGIHVSVRHTAQVKRPDGVRLHKVIRRLVDEVMNNCVPRTRPAVAAVRAAHWAISDRQAALVMVMPVQQRLITGSQLVDAARVVRGRNRRKFIWLTANDIADGAQSLGELDFGAMCRARGLPQPSRQVVRKGPRGTVYLDAGWEQIGLCVEIDGSQHLSGLAPTDDALRQNAVVMGGEVVLRMTLLGLRLDEAAFMDQVCQAHAQRSIRSR